MTIARHLAERLGEEVVLAASDVDMARHLKDYLVSAPDGTDIVAVCYPTTTAQVSTILSFASAEGISVVPQGGMSGLAGGAVPIGRSLLLSLERMRAVEQIDDAALTMTVEAGAILEIVQRAADDAGLFFPLDLGGRGSAQIGGNIATNAGGNRVLRYGMMRDLVLGLEVVLADGTVLNMLNKMLKNNSGYDLKHMFIGSEGTLGVITRAVLRLFPKATAVSTALCALPDYDAVLRLLSSVRGQLGGSLSAFEVMWPDFYRLATAPAAVKAPFPPDHGFYVLVESMDHGPAAEQGGLADAIAGAIDRGDVADAVVAQSLKEAAALWAIRDSSSELSRALGRFAGFDISVPTGRMGAFVAAHEALLRARSPGIPIVYFGHIADGNIHIAAAVRDDADEAAVEALTYDLVGAWQGAVSAEHGIGVHKRPFLHHSRSGAEIETMRRLKGMLDPRGVLNPGKVFE